jgi:hypothetical protein
MAKKTSLGRKLGTYHQRAMPSEGGAVNLKVYTTKPTTGLQKGDLLLLIHGSRPNLGVCYSTAAQGIKVVRLRWKTLGRLTA